MKIHEYQAKQIFARYGVSIPRGYPAFTVDDAESAAKKLGQETGSPVVVVKAQIHAGGRGKGGGVKVAKGGAGEARELAQKILGMQLVTHQTGPGGQKVRRLYIEQGLDIARELYLGLVVDRGFGRVVVMASSESGCNLMAVLNSLSAFCRSLFTLYKRPRSKWSSTLSGSSLTISSYCSMASFSTLSELVLPCTSPNERR